MVGVQDEQHVERLDQPLVGLEVLLAHLEQHREEVGGVAQVVVGVDVGLALRVPERPGAERRHLGDHPDDLHVPVVAVLDVPRLGVERGQRADRGHQHAHRVGVVPEALHEGLHVLVQERVVGDLVHPRVVLVLGRQLAVDEQVGDLEEVRLLRQLLDRVAAVLEDPLLAVDEGHRALARGGVDEPGVVGREARGVLVDPDLAQVGGLDVAVADGDLVVLARPVVVDGQGLVTGVGHVGSLRGSSRRAVARWFAGRSGASVVPSASAVQPMPRGRAADHSGSRFDSCSDTPVILTVAPPAASGSLRCGPGADPRKSSPAPRAVFVRRRGSTTGPGISPERSTNEC